jgi:hypothetical protein
MMRHDTADLPAIVEDRGFILLFRFAGVIAFRSADPEVSLVLVRLWKDVVIAFSPRGRWVEFTRAGAAP